MKWILENYFEYKINQYLCSRKDYDEDFNSYTLGIPNNEVRIGLTKALVPAYVMPNTLIVNNTARNIARHLTKDDIDAALGLLQTFLGTVPYCNDTNTEGHYQQVLYIIFTLVSDYFADVEIHTPTGRVDIVLQTKTTLYLFELTLEARAESSSLGLCLARRKKTEGQLKLDKNAQAAMNQIDLKDYKQKFALCGLPIVKVGINFDSEKRTIGDWKIESSR